MLRVIFHLMRKEFLQVLHDKAMLGVIFIMPIIQLTILSYAITTDIKNIVLVIEDGDFTAESRMLCERFLNSLRFDFKGYVENHRHMQSLFDQNRASIGLMIARGYESDIGAGRNPDVQIIVDGVDSNSALIAAGFSRAILMDHLKSRMDLSVSDVIRIRALYNPALESRFTVIPGIIALIFTLVTMLLTALGLVREREIGTLEQLNVTPIRPIQLVIGKIMPFAILGGLAFIMALSFAKIWFEIPVQGSVTSLAVLTAAYLITTLGLGMFISTASSTQQQAVFFAWFLLVSNILMSGFMFPISNMPPLLQKFTLIIPLRYYIAGLRDILLKGSSLHDIANQLIPLVIFGAVIFTLSIMTFQKRVK